MKSLARSELMSRVRSRDTTPEKVVRSALHRRGKRFRLHRKDLPGTPDIVLPSRRTAVFVHGCFWHGCTSCDKGKRRPRTNVEFWDTKLDENQARDRRKRRELEESGWRVVTIWECQTKDEARLSGVLDRYFGD